VTIEKSPRFKDELESIVSFIAKDSVKNALVFYEALLEKINEIPDNPYIHRKRLALNDENVRELIFKGYTIPYEIDNTKNKIIILGIFSQNLWQ
jgi:plasmid stabilization system protein ParE